MKPPDRLSDMIKRTAIIFASIVSATNTAYAQCNALEGTYVALGSRAELPPIQSITIGHGRDGNYPIDLRMNRFVADRRACPLHIKANSRGYGFSELKGEGRCVADVDNHGHSLLLIMDWKNLSTPQMHPYSVYQTLSYTLYDHGQTCAYSKGDLYRKKR